MAHDILVKFCNKLGNHFRNSCAMMEQARYSLGGISLKVYAPSRSYHLSILFHNLSVKFSNLAGNALNCKESGESKYRSHPNRPYGLGNLKSSFSERVKQLTPSSNTNHSKGSYPIMRLTSNWPC